MPRPSELSSRGRDDLRQAMNRFGGATKIGAQASLVPYREWSYFEGQLQLLKGLKSYLDKFHDGDYTVFPMLMEVKLNGYDQLHGLILYYGGRRFVSARLDMDRGERKKKSKQGDMDDLDMAWGPFDLEFGIELLEFVREDQCQRKPPLAQPVLSMPSQRQFLRADRLYLDSKVQEYGGYENVARRLGLEF